MPRHHTGPAALSNGIFCVTIIIIETEVPFRRLLLMLVHCGRKNRALVAFLSILLMVVASPAFAAEKMRLRVNHYQIDAELSPHSHKITAKAKVEFTALEDVTFASFELHNDLRLTKVLDAAGKPLNAERITQDSTV